MHSHRQAPIEIREVGNEGSTFQGYAVLWDSINQHSERFVKGSFKKTLKRFNKKTYLPVLHEHGRNGEGPIGRYVEHVEDDKGLLVKGELFTSEEAFNDTAKRIAYNLRNGVSICMSVGFRHVREQYLNTEKIFEVLEANLYEVSLTIAGSDAGAQVTRAADMLRCGSIPSYDDVARALETAGFPGVSARAIAHAGVSGLVTDAESVKNLSTLANKYGVK